jgi:hypothetical protein
MTSVLLLLWGLVPLQTRDLKIGTRASAVGAGMAALAVFIAMIQLIHVIPTNQPGQRSLLVVPCLGLIVLSVHVAVVCGKLRELDDAALMAALNSTDPASR